MRIGFVLGEFPRISETFILSQITGLIERGHEVAVYAGRPGPRGPVHPDVGRYRLLERVRYWPELSGRRLALLRLRLALLTRGGSGRRGLARRGLHPGGHDVLVAHFGHVGLEALQLREAGVLPGKLVTFFHGYDMSAFLARNGPRTYERLFRCGECFLAVSGHWQQRLEALGCPPDRTAVHRMGVDCSRFGFRPRSLDPDGVMRVVSVARLVEKKGIDCGLRAVARALRRHPEIEYTIIGDGPLRGRLTALAAELGLGRGRRRCGGGAGRPDRSHGHRDAGREHPSQRHSRAGGGRGQRAPRAGRRRGGTGRRPLPAGDPPGRVAGYRPRRSRKGGGGV